MKRRYHALGLFAGLIVTALFVVYVVRSLHGRDLSIYATPHGLFGIVAATLMWMTCMPLMSLAWRGMLDSLGVHKSWRELTAILAITQFAKYVPGNVAQYVGRAGMSLARGINARAFAATVLLEILLVIGAALCVGVSTGVLSAAGAIVVHRKSAQLAMIALLFVLAAATLLVFRKLAPALLRRFAPRHAHVLEGNLLPSRTSVAVAFALYCVVYLFAGIGLILLAHLLLPGVTHDNWLLVASFSLAWVVGFVTPGAPAGLGVREGLLLLMLAPVYTPATASVMVIALRVATTLGDVLNLACGWLLLPRNGGAPHSQAPVC